MRKDRLPFTQKIEMHVHGSETLEARAPWFEREYIFLSIRLVNTLNLDI